MARPRILNQFSEEIGIAKKKQRTGNEKITEAVYKYGYTQAEVADYREHIIQVLNNSRFKACHFLFDS